MSLLLGAVSAFYMSDNDASSESSQQRASLTEINTLFNAYKSNSSFFSVVYAYISPSLLP